MMAGSLITHEGGDVRMHLFISYAHKDKQTAGKLVDLLRRGGHEPWFDEKLRAGLPWQNQLREAIARSDGIVLALSPNWLASEWCQWEFVTAVGLGKLVIPVLLEQTKLPVVLGEIQYADFTAGFADEARTQKFLDDLAFHAVTIAPEEAPPAPEKPRGKPSRAIAERGWTVPAIIGLMVGLLTLAVTVVAVLPETMRNNVLGNIGLIPPSPTPTPLATPTPTPTLVPTPTPIPILMPFTPAPFQDRALLDVAAGGGHVWFTTDGGLYHVVEGETDATLIPGTEGVPFDALAVDSAGITAWFVRTDTQQIGRYLLDSGDLDWLTPEVEGLAGVMAVEVGSDGTAWFGDWSGLVFRLTPEGVWQALPPAEPPIESIISMSLGEVNGLPSLWLVGSPRGLDVAYQWYDGRWLAVTVGEACQGIDCVLNAAVGDAQNRAWIGHSRGLTLRSEKLGTLRIENCTADRSQFDVIVDMAVTGAGRRELWIVTRSELARLDLTQETIANRCEDWTWQTWQDDPGFFREETAADYRLAADESPAGEGLAVWAIQRGTNRVRRLVWR
jgi:hypothetical protein